MQRGQVSASCLVQPPEVKPTDEDVKACIKDDQLLLPRSSWFAAGEKMLIGDHLGSGQNSILVWKVDCLLRSHSVTLQHSEPCSRVECRQL